MTDRDDHPLSSEDLIRRARDRFDEGGADATVPSTEPRVREPITYERAPIAAPESVDAAAVGTSTREPSPLTQPDGTADSDERIAFTPPPPMRTSRRPRVFQRFGGWILIGVIALGGFVWRAIDNTVAVDALGIGDCIEDPGDGIITDVESIDCSKPHDYEVFALVTARGGRDAPYPGEDELFFEIGDLCVGRWQSFIGLPYADSVYYLNAIFPTQESWDDENDRSATCLAYAVDSADNIIPVTGSLRNVQR